MTAGDRVSFLTELKRRNVIRVGVLYAVFSWLILQVADVIFGVTRLPDWSLTLVAVILGLGFVPTLVFAWIFELTPEGVKREREIDRTQSITHHTARKLDLAVIALIVLAMGLFVADRFMGPQTIVRQQIVTETSETSPPAETPASPAAPEIDSTRPSVAVLPFTNMSTDADQEFFSDGLSDTLIHVLAQIKDLKVVARTSSFAFKGQQADVREIAEKLGVAAVLEGSVQKAGNQMRIIAQLIDASDGTHLWSGTFDRSTDDIFAIQDEIASEVVKALKGTLLEEESDRITEQYEPSFEAYQAFLRGRQRMAERTSGALEAARAHFERALELDTDYPLALINLGDTYRLLTEYGDRTIPEAIEQAEPLYQRALELAPDMGELHAGLGGLYRLKRDWDRAIASFEKAIELNPGYSTAYHWYALRLGGMGRLDEALEMFVKAAELDPLSDVIRGNLIAYLDANGRNDEALQLANTAIEDSPEFPAHYITRGSLDLDRGDLGRFIYWSREAIRRDPGNLGRKVTICFALYELPDAIAGEQCAREVGVENPDSDMVIALQMYAMILINGQADEAIELGQRYGETADLTQTRGVGGLLSLAYAVEGDYQRSVDLILTQNPELQPDNNGGEVTDFNWGDAIGLAYLWRQLGETDRSDDLVEQIWSIIEGRPRNGPGGMGVADAELYALTGNQEEAMASLTEAVNDGWVWGWRWQFLRNPVMNPIRDNEDFKALGDQVYQRLIAQQAWLDEQPPLHEVIESGADLNSI